MQASEDSAQEARDGMKSWRAGSTKHPNLNCSQYVYNGGTPV